MEWKLAIPTSRLQKALQDRAVLDHLPLVVGIAARVHESLPALVDVDDLICAGVIGLRYAASAHDPKKKAIFLTYVKHAIRAAILDSLGRALRPAKRKAQSKSGLVNAPVNVSAAITRR